MSFSTDLQDYYQSLLIIQYNNKPKAVAEIRALTEEVAANGVSVSVLNGFSIDDAVGKQLDTIAKYVGVNRTGRTFNSNIILGDDEFRSLIKIGIVRNSAGSSLFEIQSLLKEFFDGVLLVRDFKNMRIGYLFDEEIGSRPLAELFVSQGLLPKPMGVQLSSLIYSNNVNSFFGFTDYNSLEYQNTGFNSYGDYIEEWPWLKYENSI